MCTEREREIEREREKEREKERERERDVHRSSTTAELPDKIFGASQVLR